MRITKIKFIVILVIIITLLLVALVIVLFQNRIGSLDREFYQGANL